MSLIACDQSTVKFGVAFGSEADAAPKTLVLRGPGADESVFDRTLAGFSESISLLIRNISAKHCLIETPLMLTDRSAHTAMALIQLTGAIRSAATRAGCKVTLVAVSTVRRHFLGKGNLPSAEAKRAVMERCRLLGWNVEDDNAGDAAALWAYGMALYYPRWAPRAAPLFARARA